MLGYALRPNSIANRFGTRQHSGEIILQFFTVRMFTADHIAEADHLHSLKIKRATKTLRPTRPTT